MPVEIALPVPEPPELDGPVPVALTVPEVWDVKMSQNEEGTITQWSLNKRKLTVDENVKRSDLENLAVQRGRNTRYVGSRGY